MSKKKNKLKDKEIIFNNVDLSEIDTTQLTQHEVEALAAAKAIEMRENDKKLMEDQERERKKEEKNKKFRKIMMIVIMILFIMLLMTRCSVEQLPLPEKVQDIIDKGFADTVGIDEVPEITYEFDDSNTMTNIVWGMNPVLKFENGKAEAELRLTSGEENLYNLYFDINLIDNQGNKGPLLYSSDLIKPGQVLLNDSFDVNLPAGTYRGRATVNALDPETSGFLGKSEVNITIYIANTVQ